jgi:hypothetical protein
MRWHGKRRTGTPESGSRCRPNDRAVEHDGTAVYIDGGNRRPGGRAAGWPTPGAEQFHDTKLSTWVDGAFHALANTAGPP